MPQEVKRTPSQPNPKRPVITFARKEMKKSNIFELTAPATVHAPSASMARSFSRGFTFDRSNAPLQDAAPSHEDRLLAPDSGDEGGHASLIPRLRSAPTVQTCKFAGVDESDPKLPRLNDFPFPITPGRVADAVDVVKSSAQLAVQNQFSPAVREMLRTDDFFTLVHSMLWYLVVTLQEKYNLVAASVPGRPSLAVVRNSLIFHVVAMRYGHLFSTLPLPPVAGTRVMDHKERTVRLLPMLIPKVVYYLASTVFTTAEDERKFDAALRGTLQKTFSYWVLGIVPQRLTLSGWPKAITAREVRQPCQFSPAKLSADMDRTLAGERRPVRGQRSHLRRRRRLSSGSSGSGGGNDSGDSSAGACAGNGAAAGAALATSSRGDGCQRRASCEWPSGAEQRNPRTHEGRLQQLPLLAASSEIEAAATPPSRQSPRRRGEVIPTLLSSGAAGAGTRWFEYGAVRGHLTAERLNDKPSLPTSLLRCESTSPLMQHYLAALQVDVARHGVDRTITWTPLSSLDATRTVLRFGAHAEAICEKSSGVIAERIKAAEAIADGERHDVVQGQKKSQFWAGKARRAQMTLTALYSIAHPPTRARFRALMRELRSALAPHANVIEHINVLTAALVHADGVIFSIPMPHRHRAQLLSVRCFRRLKSLERRLPAVLEVREHVFGETIAFSPDALRQLENLFGTICRELSARGITVDRESGDSSGSSDGGSGDGGHDATAIGASACASTIFGQLARGFGDSQERRAARGSEGDSDADARDDFRRTLDAFTASSQGLGRSQRTVAATPDPQPNNESATTDDDSSSAAAAAAARCGESEDSAEEADDGDGGAMLLATLREATLRASEEAEGGRRVQLLGTPLGLTPPQPLPGSDHHHQQQQQQTPARSARHLSLGDSTSALRHCEAFALLETPSLDRSHHRAQNERAPQTSRAQAADADSAACRQLATPRAPPRLRLAEGPSPRPLSQRGSTGPPRIPSDWLQ